MTVLRADGYTVDGAADRTAVASLIDRHAYAVVLSVLCMPGLDGPELVRLLEERRPLELPALMPARPSPRTSPAS